MIKKTFTIKDMHCSSCVMRIEGIEDDLPGIKRIYASYQKQKMEIEYNENIINEGQIIKAIEKLGYHIEMD
jgi:copper chaperone CopZ